MNQQRLRVEGGFTLVEILVVIAILGVLAAIAITQFSAYQKRGLVSQVQSDLKNAATAEEAYFTANQVYVACDPCTDATLRGFFPTPDVKVKAEITAPQSFRLTGSHTGCGADVWTYETSTGQITDDGTPCQ